MRRGYNICCKGMNIQNMAGSCHCKTFVGGQEATDLCELQDPCGGDCWWADIWPCQECDPLRCEVLGMPGEWHHISGEIH